MQRTGRTGHAQFRVVVQDSRFHPTSGRVVAYVGNYDPHTKAAKLDGEKISKYLANGAQPSERVAKLLSKEGIKLPDWFVPAAAKKGTVRNADKRRSTRPKGAAAPSPAQTLPDKVSVGEPKVEVTEESAVTEPAEPTDEAAPTEETVTESIEQTPEAEATPETEEPTAKVEAPAEAERPKTE
ncbi:MAG: 30S ribosomal protein S16 [bacterium]|nr:30S ribosomal protein S16 [bacterium]